MPSGAIAALALVASRNRHPKNALQNAASIAGLMLTTEALVAEIPEEKEKSPAMPGGGGMGDMY